MSLGNLAKNIYNGNVSLDAAKKRTKENGNMLFNNFIDYNPIKNVYKNQRSNILLNATEF